jgi:PAS domain S-box-containing protein
MNFRSRLVLGFGAALCILVIIGALSYRKFLQEDADQQWVSHTHQVLEKLDAIRATLLELDAAERGFILTKEDAYRQSSWRLASSIESQLKDVRTATADNPVQQAVAAQLEVLLNERTALLKKAEEHAGSRIALGEDLNREAITRIRAALLSMRAEEERLLGQRLQRAESGTRQMKFIVALGYGFSLLLFALTVYTVFREIEKRKRSEERMRHAQEQYRLLFDSNPIPVWVYDAATLSILDANATAVAAYGYAREEFLRLKISDLRPAAEIPRLLTDLQELRQQAQESGPWKHQKKSGEIIDVQIRSYPLAFGGKNARLVVATDITDQQKAEHALKESEERFRLIVSNIKDYAIIVLDPQGEVTSWNGGAQRIKGYAAEDILGRHFSVFYPPEDVAAGKPVRELNAARDVGRFEDEGWWVRKDGSRFWANVLVTPLADDAGRLRGFVKTTRDIMERRKAEQEILRRSQELETANKELEAFSYSVSHDLRAPAARNRRLSQAPQEDYEQQLDGTARDYLHRIRTATHRMGELIDDLLIWRA